MCLIKLGDIVEAIITLLTLGHGLSLAQWIAKKRGFEDCGCDRRKQYLNELCGCKTKSIKLQ